MEYKYVVLKVVGEEIEREVPIIFPKLLVHDEMAKRVKHMVMLTTPNIIHVEPVSAGFVDLGTLNCYGLSESMGKLKSRGKEDTLLIMTQAYTGGVRDPQSELFILNTLNNRPVKGEG